MSKPRLYLKLDIAERNILNVAKTEMSASSYRELILTLINGEYIDYLCNSVLVEKAIRKILVNLNQLKTGYNGTGDLQGLINEIQDTSCSLITWNNNQIMPVFKNKGTVIELQIRVSNEEKSLIRSAKIASGFKTFGDLIVHLCCAFISNKYNLPSCPDFTLFDAIGKAINNEARAYNTYKNFNIELLDKNLDGLYELIQELKVSISNLGGNDVRKH